jgi:hypothetical protein
MLTLYAAVPLPRRLPIDDERPGAFRVILDAWLALMRSSCRMTA